MAVNRRNNWFLLAAIALGTGLFYMLTAALSGALAVAAVSLVSIFTGRLKLDTIGQVIVALFCALLAYLMAIVFGTAGPSHLQGTIGPIATTLALWLLLVSAQRLFQAAPAGGVAASAGIVFMAVLAMGEVPGGSLYPLAAVAVLISLLLAIRHADPGRPRAARMIPLLSRSGALVWALSVFIGGGLMVSLPIAYQWLFERMVLAYEAPVVGFGYALTLGDLAGMDDSQSVVMRIRGPQPDYLRGALYTRYQHGMWIGARGNERRPVAFEEGHADQASITKVAIVGGERDRYFLPINAVARWVNGGAAQYDADGILLPGPEREADAVWFEIGPETGPAQAPPDPKWLAVPPDLLPTLRAIAQSWTAEAMTPSARLAAVEQHLKREFSYARQFSHPGFQDPLISFLTKVRAGHCEYFASAMALISRTLGIPTRVVAGYRVHEWNALGGYYVVREKNAHSWVEAWLPETGWQTVDPTPKSELYGNQTSGVAAALLDLAAEHLRLMGERLSRMTRSELALAVGGLLLLWIAVILFRRWRHRRPDAPAAKSRGYEATLPAVAKLYRMLEQLGEPRLPHEPVERYAERIAEVKRLGGKGPALARLLQDYSAWRFGGMGDPQAISQAITKWMGEAEQRRG